MTTVNKNLNLGVILMNYPLNRRIVVMSRGGQEGPN